MDHRYLAKALSKWWQSYDKTRRLVKVSFSEIIIKAEELGEDIDKETLKLLDEDECALLPFEFVVCSTCNGDGTHTNPDIDSHGITADEWNRDWSFEDQENYMSGFYDIQCYNCGGDKVIPEIVEERLTKDKKKLVRLLDKHRQEEIDRIKDRHHEVSMGY